MDILEEAYRRAKANGGTSGIDDKTFDDIEAKYVRLTANSNWGGIINQYGLSEVRFLQIECARYGSRIAASDGS